MSDYFKFFPKVTHTKRSAVDITRRTAILESIANDPYMLYPYTVQDDYRPEHVAEFYYGDPNKVWLVYYANNIIDFYSQWPLSSDDFNKYLMKKYEEQAGTTGYSVIAWTQNTQLSENIVYYENIEDPEIQINTRTYENDDSLIGAEWRAVRYYDYETIVNDNKRNIYLIGDNFADQFERDLEELLNE